MFDMSKCIPVLFVLWHVNGTSGICTLFNIGIILSHKSYATSLFHPPSPQSEPPPCPINCATKVTQALGKQLACQLIQCNTNPTERENAIKNQGMSVSIMVTFGSLHNNPLPNMQNIRANILSAGVHSQLQFCVTMKRLRAFGVGVS